MSYYQYPPTPEIYTLSLQRRSSDLEANPNELNQDDARYGFRCCHLKNIWTAPLPPETEMAATRSEERFSRNAETDLVCRLLLEKKKRDAEITEGVRRPGDEQAEH